MYGTNCLFAHSEQELERNNQFYEASKRREIDGQKYKTQHCKAYLYEKVCVFGRRCHFKHDQRTYNKIHRHFYMMHLAAQAIKHEDILAESKDQGVEVALQESKQDFALSKDRHNDTESDNNLLEMENESALDISTDSSDSVTDN